MAQQEERPCSSSGVLRLGSLAPWRRVAHALAAGGQVEAPGTTSTLH